MLAYAAFVTSTPRLLTPQTAPQSISAGLETIARQLEQNGIQHIVSLAEAPPFNREGLSAYVHPELELSFAEFGDLSTKEFIPYWWNGYYRLKQLYPLPVEPIDTHELDYRHAIMFHALRQYRSPGVQHDYLPINLPSFPIAETFDALTDAIQKLTHQQPYALLCPVALYAANSAQAAQQAHEQNQRLRTFIQAQQTPPLPAGHQPNLIDPDFTHIYQLFYQSVFSQGFAYQELAFEELDASSVLIGHYVKR